jgi:molybdopterin synthase sulfur carrier subunit
VRLLYFAWVRQKIGVAEEEVTPPGSVSDVAALIEWLKGRGEGYASAFENLKLIRVAIDQDYVDFGTAIADAGEIAFFPPVTGG